jgi:WD40 repeat protein
VSFLAFRPDGGAVASVGHDRTVRLWNAATGEPMGTFSDHKGLVSSVAFSPDGQLFASAGHDGKVLLWDPRSGEARQTITGHAGRVLSVAFSPDGRLLASAGGVERGVAEVRLWDTGTGQLKGTLAGHSDWALWVGFSPDGMTLASGSYGEVILSDLRSGKPVRTIRKTDWSMVAFDFSAEGGLLVCGCWAFPSGDDGRPDYRQAVGGLQFWETATGKLMRDFPAHDREVTSVSLSPAGRTLVSGSRDGTVRIWDTAGLLHQAVRS